LQLDRRISDVEIREIGAFEQAKGEHVMPDSTEPVSFETDVKPMFRERDRESMEFAFDLWSLDDVSEHADAILARLRDGSMPCDGGWSQAQIDVFQRWIASGKPG
jgi:hypothetical protein